MQIINSNIVQGFLFFKIEIETKQVKFEHK